MQNNDIFEVVLLLGRPAAGKSEILDFLEKVDHPTRVDQYHIGDMDVIDDFPMLWTWFEEDAILSEKFGKPRLHSDEKRYFKYPYLWNLLIERISLEYQKKIRDNGQYHERATTIIEFARGTEHGGYQQAFEHLSDHILERAGIVYVQVSFEESRRKNRKRFNPERPDSILEHAVDDKKLETLYRHDDWKDLVAGSNLENILQIRQHKVPFVTFENEDDVTTKGATLLGDRLQDTFSRLWAVQQRSETP